MALWTTINNAVRPAARLYMPMSGRPPRPIEQLLADAERTAGQIWRSCLPTPEPPRIGLLMANGEPWLRGLFAAFRMGATAVPLALPVLATGLDNYLRQLSRVSATAQLSAILLDDSVQRFTTRIQHALPAVPLVDISEVPDGPLPRDLPNESDEHGLTIIQYTSGSTSAPKGVALTQANVEAGKNTLLTALGWTADDTVGVWLPLFHDMGLISVLSSVAAGSSVCLWRPSDFVRNPMRWLASFAESPATGSPAPNFAYDYLVTAARFGLPDGLDLSRWRVACNGAEPVRHRTIEAFDRTFRPVGWQPEVMRPCYGLAEATLMVAFTNPGARPRHLTVDRLSLGVGQSVRPAPDNAAEARQVVSVGPAAAGIQVRIAVEGDLAGSGSGLAGSGGGRTGSGGSPVGSGVVGEIQVLGPAVMSRYIDVPEEAQPFTADGWLKTGDLGFFDDGELFVVGRLKDIIVVRGQNYYAEDIEELARQSAGPAAFRSAALLLDADDTEAVVVVVETALQHDDAAGLAKKIEKDIAGQVGLETVSVLPVTPRSIPVTTSGKVQRQAARRKFEDQLMMQCRFGKNSIGGPQS